MKSTEKTACSTGLKKNVVKKATFDRELALCAKLSKKNGGKCCWGACSKCGVVPLLYKLHKGILLETKEDIAKAKKDILPKKK